MLVCFGDMVLFAVSFAVLLAASFASLFVGSFIFLIFSNGSAGLGAFTTVCPAALLFSSELSFGMISRPESASLICFVMTSKSSFSLSYLNSIFVGWTLMSHFSTGRSI